MRTIQNPGFVGENEEITGPAPGLPKDSPNNVAESESEADVSHWPRKLKHRGKVLARIYKRPTHPHYRLYWRVRTAEGKAASRMRDFGTYSEAKREGDKLVAQLAKGSQVTALTPGQANDALAAFERLHGFYVSTGRKISLLGAVSEWAESAAKLGERPLSEAVDGFLSTVAVVKRMDLGKAVEDFIAAEAPRTKASDGKRAQLSPKYAYNRAIMLRRFSGMFPGHAVCDLAKGHLDAFFASLGGLATKSRNQRHATSAKSRNHHRAAVRQFLQWAIRKDYLPANHRLGEADAMRPENGNTADVEFYSPVEFKALLETAEGPMRAMVAIGGLAGLRTSELLRLTWEDARRVEGHIEITAGKAKTRQRRLVEIVPALAQWLAPFDGFTGKVWPGHEITFQQHLCALCDRAEYETKPGQKATVKRKANGLRHAYCTYHLALHGNENATALQAGNSPAMLHGNYKGLATKKEAEAWFAMAPALAANVIPLANSASQ